MLLYLCWFRPFTNTKVNAIQIFNESVILFAFLGILIINKVNPNNEVIDSFGVIVIVSIFVSLIATWIMILPKLLGDLKNTISRLCKKKTKKSKSKHSKSKNKRKIMTEPAKSSNQKSSEVNSINEAKKNDLIVKTKNNKQGEKNVSKKAPKIIMSYRNNNIELEKEQVSNSKK